MIVPRKSTLFQSDLYPDTLADIPAIGAKEWFQGRNVQPTLRSMKTGESILDTTTSQKTRSTEGKYATIHHTSSKHNVLNNHHGNHNGNSNNHSHSNGTNGTTVNSNNYTNGVTPLSNGGKNNKENEIDNRKFDNNTKKFAFLSQPTIPDYRPQAVTNIIEKSQKTSTNQSTKFHQLQAIFGQHQPANHKDIANLQNNLLSSSRNSSRNSSLENINLLNSENELRKAFNKQAEEIKSLRKSLNNSEKRVRELEAEVKRLQVQQKR